MRKLALPYTIRRNGVYQLNLRWHKDFLRYSLATRDPQIALSKVNRVIETIVAESPQTSPSVIKRKVLAALNEFRDHTPEKPVYDTRHSDSLLLSDAFRAYKEEQVIESWHTRTTQQNESTFKILKEIVGDISLAEVSRETARKYKRALLLYPANRNKGQRKGKTLEQLVTEGYPPIGLETVRNSMGRVSSFFNWLVRQGYTNDNYFAGLAPRRSYSARSERSPFTPEELGAIFGTPLYTQKSYRHNWQYWLPLLGLFTGARIEELCQLRGQDIKAEGGVYYFDIHGEGDLHNRVKTACAVRCVPVHPALIKLGVIQLKNEAGDGFLFNLKRINTNLSHKPSQWFSDYKTALGFPKGTKVFHSFRHTLRDELTRCSIPAEHVRELLGHEQQGETFGRYGSSIPTCILHKSLSKVVFSAIMSLPDN